MIVPRVYSAESRDPLPVQIGRRAWEPPLRFLFAGRVTLLTFLKKFLIPPTIPAAPASLYICICKLNHVCNYFCTTAVGVVFYTHFLTVHVYCLAFSVISCIHVHIVVKLTSFAVLGIVVSVTYFMCAFQINLNASFSTQLYAFVQYFA